MKERGEVCVCSYQQERKYMHVKEINSLDNTQKNEGNHQVIRIYIYTAQKKNQTKKTPHFHNQKKVCIYIKIN